MSERRFMDGLPARMGAAHGRRMQAQIRAVLDRYPEYGFVRDTAPLTLEPVVSTHEMHHECITPDCASPAAGPHSNLCPECLRQAAVEAGEPDGRMKEAE